MRWFAWRRIFRPATRWWMVRAISGNIDGDSAAAYRYTEARMTEVARLLLQGIDEDGVPFRPNYDGQNEEPIVPARRLSENLWPMVHRALRWAWRHQSPRIMLPSFALRRWR